MVPSDCAFNNDNKKVQQLTASNRQLQNVKFQILQKAGKL